MRAHGSAGCRPVLWTQEKPLFLARTWPLLTVLRQQRAPSSADPPRPRKDPGPALGAPLSWLYLNLATSPRPHLPVPSPGVRASIYGFWGHTHSVHNVLLLAPPNPCSSDVKNMLVSVQEMLQSAQLSTTSVCFQNTGGTGVGQTLHSEGDIGPSQSQPSRPDTVRPTVSRAPWPARGAEQLVLGGPGRRASTEVRCPDEFVILVCSLLSLHSVYRASTRSSSGPSRFSLSSAWAKGCSSSATIRSGTT